MLIDLSASVVLIDLSASVVLIDLSASVVFTGLFASVVFIGLSASVVSHVTSVGTKRKSEFPTGSEPTLLDNRSCSIYLSSHVMPCDA